MAARNFYSRLMVSASGVPVMTAGPGGADGTQGHGFGPPRHSAPRREGLGSRRMKAIVQNGFGSPDVLELREIDRPAVADDTVLVRVRAASLNAFDSGLLMRRLIHVIAWLMGRPMSRIRGGDLAGVVEACGSKVSRFRPGDEVFGVGRGTLAEYVATTEARLAPRPRALTFEQAAAMPVAGCTALQGMRDRARVQPGQRVLVYGAGGGTGTFAVQIAKAFGAHVTAVTRTEHMELLRSIGADDVIDYTREDFTRLGRRWDVVFDIGADRPPEEYERALADGGQLVLVGAPKQAGALLKRIAMALFQPRAGRRVTLSAKANAGDLTALADLVEAGKLAPVIDRTYPLSEAADAFRYLGTGRAGGKIAITIP
jgi:NADPH:quinone reductase-like Zn-dependent oxidoreductase